MGSADITGSRGSGEGTDPWEEAQGLFEMYLIDMMKFSKRGCGHMADIYFTRKPFLMTGPSIARFHSSSRPDAA
jgi:hypothetical protein